MATFTNIFLSQETHPRANRNGLRLAPVDWLAAHGHVASIVTRSAPCLVLRSALGDKNVVNETALGDLVQTLHTGERIEFCNSSTGTASNLDSSNRHDGAHPSNSATTLLLTLWVDAGGRRRTERPEVNRHSLSRPVVIFIEL